MMWAFAGVSGLISISVFFALRIFYVEILTRRKIIQRVAGKQKGQQKEPAWFQPIASLREAAGISMPFSRWLMLTVLGIVLGLVLGIIGLKNIVVGLLLAPTLAAIPTWLIHFYAVRYREKVAEGLIPAFETFYSEYTVTRNIPKAMDLVSKQAPDPAKGEFQRMAGEIYSGQSTKEVLNGFTRRMNNRWVRLFSALLIMRDDKGSRIEQPLLNMIAEQKKRQMETKKERSEMAQVRMVHLVLMLASIGLFLFNLISRPESYRFFTESSGGRWVMVFIVAALLISLIIFMLMNRKEVD